MNTIDNIMALADEYVGRSQLTEQGETLSRKALHTALTEALAAQPVREPLSDEQINSIWKKWVGTPRANMSFVRAIERAHGIGGDK